MRGAKSQPSHAVIGPSHRTRIRCTSSTPTLAMTYLPYLSRRRRAPLPRSGCTGSGRNRMTPPAMRRRFTSTITSATGTSVISRLQPCCVEHSVRRPMGPEHALEETHVLEAPLAELVAAMLLEEP